MGGRFCVASDGGGSNVGGEEGKNDHFYVLTMSHKRFTRNNSRFD